MVVRRSNDEPHTQHLYIVQLKSSLDNAKAAMLQAVDAFPQMCNEIGWAFQEALSTAERGFGRKGSDYLMDPLGI